MILKQYIIDKWMRGKWHTNYKPEGYIAQIASRTLESRHFEITNVATYVQKVMKDRPDFKDLRIKLPYHTCFFEFQREETYKDGSREGLPPNYVDHLYCGALLWEPEWSDDTVLCSCFMSTKQTREAMKDLHVYPIVDYEFPRDWTGGLESVDQIKYTMRPVIRSFGQDVVDNMLTIGYNICKPVLYAVALLNCKNLRTVVQSNHDGKTKAERKRIFRQEYHVLDVPLMNRIASGEIKIDGEHGVPIHTVRGHFKTYTAEKPLLGKHVGQYWWDSHVRGSAEYGIVEKDYSITAESRKESAPAPESRTQRAIQPALFNAVSSALRKP